MNLLQDYVTSQAERRPDATAVVLGDASLTYGELEARSNQLALVLKDQGCRRGDRVCWLGPKSPAALIGILGIYKADAIYVPLDTSSPAARLKRILDSCEPACILAGGTAGERLDELAGLGALTPAVRLGWMTGPPPRRRGVTTHFTDADVEQYPSIPLRYQNTGADPAHIFFTSGSTGAPKGVVITHANVTSFIAWAIQYFGFGPEDRHSGHSPLHFDLSIFDIFGTLAAGAELHMMAPGLAVLPKLLVEFIRSHALTQWFSVPSVLTYLAGFDAVAHRDFPALRRLLWCGEVLPTPTLVHWMQRLPHVRFTNLYGPTETTIASSVHTVQSCPDNSATSIPIGMPCTGEDMVVLDADGRTVAPDEIGELHIGGAGLSPGYWRDPDKTADAFRADPRGTVGRLYRTGDLARQASDGLFYFVGRADSQIKSRGYRIELGEVETAIHSLPDVQECAVVGVPTNGFEGTLIGCAYVPRAGQPARPGALRHALSRLIQPCMVPSLWLPLDALPRNANDKVDRPRLREEFERRAAQAS